MALKQLAKTLAKMPDRDIRKYAELVNKKVDIPKLNEQQEANILFYLLKGMIESTEMLIDKVL